MRNLKSFKLFEDTSEEKVLDHARKFIPELDDICSSIEDQLIDFFEDNDITRKYTDQPLAGRSAPQATLNLRYKRDTDAVASTSAYQFFSTTNDEPPREFVYPEYFNSSEISLCLSFWFLNKFENEIREFTHRLEDSLGIKGEFKVGYTNFIGKNDAAMQWSYTKKTGN